MDVAPTPVSSPTLKPSVHYLAGISTAHIEDNGWINSGIPLSSSSTESSRTADMPNWKRDMRHEAQEILPGLWLGPFTVASSKSRLQEIGVTHLLCVRDSTEAHIVRPRFAEDFAYETLDLREHQDERLMTRLNSSLDFIHSARMGGGIVYVHCMSGMSASPTIVIAYLMRSQGLTYEDAVLQVQRRRFCITPNNALAKQLWEWESVCKAEMAMAMGTRSLMGATMQARSSMPRSKRSLDEPDEFPERNIRANNTVGWDDDSDTMGDT